MMELQEIPLALQAVISSILSYLLGCFCTGYYLVRLKTGKDLRMTGSGTLGARNAGRELGKIGFALTFAGDLLKGALAVFATSILLSSPQLTALSLVAVVGGHIFPFQLRFSGGKGYATLTGGVFVLCPKLVLILFLIVVAGSVITRMPKLCGLLAVAILPIAAIPMMHGSVYIAGVAVASILVLVAHRENVAFEFRSLFGGKERKELS